MADVGAWHGRFTLVAEGLLDSAEDLEGESPVEAEEAREQAREWRGLAVWLLENSGTLPPLPEVSDALDLTGAVGSELRSDR